MARKKKPATGVDIEKVQAALEPVQVETEARLRLIHEMPLETQEHVDILGEVIKYARAEGDKHEALRKETKAPSLEQGRRIDALFKPVGDLYKAMDRAATDRLTKFLASHKEVQCKALEAVAGGSRDANTLEAAHDVIETPEGLSDTESIEFEITDNAQIPRAFLMFDESLARSWVKHKRKNNEECSIAGVEIKIVKNVKRSGGGKKK